MKNRIEKATIGVFVEPLRAHVPFAYCLFSERDDSRDQVNLGQRRSPCKLLNLNEMVGDAADFMIQTLASLAEEQNCGSLCAVKNTFLDALMPQSTAFSFEDGEVFTDVDESELRTRVRREISNGIKKAEDRLQMIRSFHSIWLQELFVPDCVGTGK
jgi:hypothetical protein